MPYKQKMIAVPQHLRLLTAVEMIFQVLPVAFLVHGIDPVRQQLADAIGCHLMSNMHASVCQHLPALVKVEEYKRKILYLKGVMIIAVSFKVIRIVTKFRQWDHIIADKRNEQSSIRLAYPSGFRNTTLPVFFPMQMIQWPKQ